MRIALANHFAHLSSSRIRLRIVADPQRNLHESLTQLSRAHFSVASGFEVGGSPCRAAFLLSFIALGLALALLFTAYPSWEVQVAEWFFDPGSAKFPLAADYEWNIVRRGANWVPFLLLLPAVFALLRKLVFPSERMLIAPLIVLYLLGSFLIGPGLTSNLLLKENWGRPRPNSVQQFAGSAAFQPWWRPGGTCKRNCSFVSGEASLAFWTVAPASLAPAQMRPIALGAAVVFGTAVGRCGSYSAATS